jgi:hypothetical protein
MPRIHILPDRVHLSRRCRWLAYLVVVLASACLSSLAAIAKILPAFAYREITVSVVQADGNPVAGASIYGFCRDLNLVWPRPVDDREWAGPDVWLHSYLGQTDANGKIRAKIPPGAWSFFAAASLPGDSPTALVVWSDFREPTSGETIQLAPTARKTWTFCLPNGTPASPQQLFFKPAGLPIWIPVTGTSAGQPRQVQLSAGRFELWGAADATAAQPGFVLAWGALDDKIPDGKILPQGKTALLEFKGGGGRSQLAWSSWHNFGLEGSVALAMDAKVGISTGDFTLGYRRPFPGGLMGTFVGEFDSLKPAEIKVFNLDTPLTAALQQDLRLPKIKDEDTDDADAGAQAKLYAQLFLVDGNRQLLLDLEHGDGQPARFTASVKIAGVQISAENAPDQRGTISGNQTLFVANVTGPPAANQTTWNISGPPGILPATQFMPAKLVDVTSGTFKIAVPAILEAHAKTVLAQAEVTAAAMDAATGLQRHVTPTKLSITPANLGGSALHDGSLINMGTKLLYSDSLLLQHTFVHELGHNYGFTHGGLHETSNEVTRSTGTEQISNQPAKWMFLDRMNGLTHKEVGYHNTGLYLYCYSQGGEPFLHFISHDEYTTIKALSKDYTTDEVETAVLGLALGRDLTEICEAYGLKVTPARVALATAAAQPLCQIPPAVSGAAPPTH